MTVLDPLIDALTVWLVLMAISAAFAALPSAAEAADKYHDEIRRE